MGEAALLPDCEELNLPIALMIGVKRQVNPLLKMAGDGMGRGSVEAVEYLCAKFPKNKFMVTMLSRENQHQLCVSARKFRNLLVIGEVLTEKYSGLVASGWALEEREVQRDVDRLLGGNFWSFLEKKL